LIMGAAVAAGTAVLMYFFPLFHVVSLRQGGPPAAGAAFDPVAFVDRFWTERLIPGAARAVDAGELVAAVQQDRQSGATDARPERGIGRRLLLFPRRHRSGSSPSRRTPCGCPCATAPPPVQVSLETGNVFGNAVRDGTGLLNVNDFPNSQDFNALSTEINRRIEQQVLPELRKRAAVGATVRFVGCAEITDEDTDLQPLRIVPFLVAAP